MAGTVPSHATEACWEIHTSKTTGLTYYENVQTGESSWALPLGATANSLDDGTVHSAISLMWNTGVLSRPHLFISLCARVDSSCPLCHRLHLFLSAASFEVCYGWQS